MLPLVSVIIPAYNSENYIIDAIESVLDQRYKKFEVIVIDDGSTDKTVETVSAYKGVRVISQNNSGPSRARNQGIRAAAGKYCAFLDSDDIMLPGRLEMQVEVLDKAQAVGLVYTDLMTFNEKGIVHKSKKEFVTLHRGLVLKKLLRENFITTSTVMLRRDCFLRAGYFDENLTHSEDYKMWLNISKFYQIEFVDLPLIRYRYHEGSLSSDRVVINSSSFHVVKEFWVENEEYRQKNKLSYRASMANQLGNLANAYCYSGKGMESLRVLAQVLRLNPFSKNLYKIMFKVVLYQVKCILSNGFNEGSAI